MNQRLSDEEIAELRRYERWCYDTMNHATITPRILTALLDGYKKKEDE
ncbi:hypothetical protein NRS6141_00787 [Bacillus subtilis]|nr:hypothetical protein NRS6141_00787 [Bacillus subtilis]CAF1876953.1 hypothetical protein NRS6204_00325 [Bacillus subtilis]CAF1878971.1 hypothetical protein NRS6205_00325 [Bacillus subtilis]